MLLYINVYVHVSDFYCWKQLPLTTTYIFKNKRFERFAMSKNKKQPTEFKKTIGWDGWRGGQGPQGDGVVEVQGDTGMGGFQV